MAETTVHYAQLGRILCDNRELSQTQRPGEDWVEGKQHELVTCSGCRRKLDHEGKISRLIVEALERVDRRDILLVIEPPGDDEEDIARNRNES